MSEIQDQPEQLTSELKCARILHPEDIAAGDDVALAKISYQFPSFLWCGADLSFLSRDHKVDITFLPADEPRPFIVKSVCLPFVLCESETGKHNVFDTRLVQLMKLDREFAASVRNALDQNGKSKKSRKSRKPKKNRKRKSK